MVSLILPLVSFGSPGDLIPLKSHLDEGLVELVLNTSVAAAALLEIDKGLAGA